MKKGCIIGCLGVAALFALVVIAGLIAADRMLGIFSPSPRVDLAAEFGSNHAISVRIDPNIAFMSGLFADAVDGNIGPLSWFMPHEAFFRLGCRPGVRR